MDIITELLRFHLSISGELRACVRAMFPFFFISQQFITPFQPSAMLAKSVQCLRYETGNRE